MIYADFFINMKKLNEQINILKEKYQTEIKIINLSATPSGYVLFYELNGETGVDEKWYATYALLRQNTSMMKH